MIKIRGRSLRLLGLAVFVIALAPCLIEIALRVAACRSSLSGSSTSAGAEVVASWTTHHQLAPLQRKLIPSPSRFSVNPDSQAAGSRVKPILFRTNSRGLRGHEIEVPRPPDVFRIIFLGDETVLGESTEESFTVAARLEHWLQTRSQMRIEVVNAGLPDSCPLLTFLRVRHGLLSLQPNLLVVDVNLSDVQDDRHVRRHTELADDGRPLVATHPELSAPKRSRALSENFLVIRHTENLLASWLTKPPSRSSETDSLAAIPARLPSEADEMSAEQLSLALSPLSDLARLAMTVSSGLVIATHPTEAELARESRQDSHDLTARLGEFAVKNGLLFCDSTSGFRTASESESLFLSRRELSERGHEVYARALAVALVDQIPGPWTPVRSRAIQAHPKSTARAPQPVQTTSEFTDFGSSNRVSRDTFNQPETRLDPVPAQR